MKLYERGNPNKTLYDIIETNSRAPMLVRGDIEAFRAACRTGEQRFLELVQTYGWELLRIYLNELLDYAERLTRNEIREMPDGEYEFTDYLDEGGGVNPDPVPIHVKITVDGDTITYDFSSTSSQVEGALNNPFGTSRAVVMTCLRVIMDPAIPRNSGAFRPIKLVIPKGTLLNPRLPAAVASRGATISRQFDTIIGAEAQIVPQEALACSSGGDILLNIGGLAQDGNPFIAVEQCWGGWGGRPFADGVEYNTPLYKNGSNQPIELNEELYPLMYTQYSFVPDTEGAGKYRGALATVREFKFTGDEATLQLRIDRRKFAPYGIEGGDNGVCAKAIINPDAEHREVGKITTKLTRGTVLQLMSAGAGGWGDPFDRDVISVLNDVVNEKISMKRAKETYGVVIDEHAMEVDTAETRKLRGTMRGRRDMSKATGGDRSQETDEALNDASIRSK
jgi:N-methylhydantoinase B